MSRAIGATHTWREDAEESYSCVDCGRQTPWPNRVRQTCNRGVEEYPIQLDGSRWRVRCPTCGHQHVCMTS